MISRRRLLQNAGYGLVASTLPTGLLKPTPGAPKSMRCVNIVNFIRGVEPRFKTDLLLPVQKQMELIRAHNFPATWLLQFDALVSGPFVDYLKENIQPNHEVGTWFEMNELHCKGAGVNWRGRPGFEWDHYPQVAFSIGYTKDERIKLANTAMNQFKQVWGHFPHSVASWNLDAFTIAHLVDQYKIDAFAVCRDQIATDGFTIWGAPIAGYYPSKNNCLSPALDPKNQINAPVLRMLGQDPVYYYDKEWEMPDGSRGGFPDTMEPVWPSGQSDTFIRTFLDMIENAPDLDFSYLQMGQENSFPWDQQASAYPRQMDALAQAVTNGKITLETMQETGQRFKKAFRVTPPQAQVQLVDPYGKKGDKFHRTVWFQNRFYRANLHIASNALYFRDLTVYLDTLKQPFLDSPTKESFVEQRMPAVMDSYHWQLESFHETKRTAGAYLQIDGKDITIQGQPEVTESKGTLIFNAKTTAGLTLQIKFTEKDLQIKLGNPAHHKLRLSFEWEPEKAKFDLTYTNVLAYRDRDTDYKVLVNNGKISLTENGILLTAPNNEINLRLAQV